jgi:hypothetical protein
LLSQNPDDAKRALGRGSCCSPNDEAAEVVRHAWELRDSAGASGATKNPVVRTLMAKCLAEYKPRFTPLEAADAPVLAQLRLALGSNDAEQVRAAAFGLTQTATAEDIQAIVSAAERLPALKSWITGAVGQVCRVVAIEAAKTIKASATDDRQRAEIENVEAHAAKMRRVWCGFDANIVPNGVSQADIADFFDPGRSDPDGSVGDLKGKLSSTNVHDAREALLKLHCARDDKETFGLVREAWSGRDSWASNLVTRDSSVRVLLAKCLAKASGPAKVPAAVKEQIA